MTAGRHWHWGMSIATVYAIFAAATLAFAVFAMNHDVDLVSPQYYAAAMSYDTRQASAERAIALPLEASIEVDPAAGGRSLLVSFPRSAMPDAGTVTLYRPSNARADRSIPVNASMLDAAGRFRVPIGALTSGPWVVQVDWTTAGMGYYAERRVVAP